MQTALDNLSASFRLYLPSIIGALVILIIGWIVAKIVSGIVRSLIRRAGLSERLGRVMGREGGGAAANAHDYVASGVFWLIMLLVIVAALETLRLTLITAPLNQLLVLIFAYIPRLIGAGILLLIAWIIARVLRVVVVRALQAARVDQRLGEQTSSPPPATVTAPSTAPTRPTSQQPPLSQTLGEIVYWLVFLLFLPAILSALQLPGILAPVQTLVERVLAFIPNIAAAALILIVGWFVARLIQRIVVGLLAGLGVDRLSERVGLSETLGSQGLSGVLGLLVYVLILVPVLIAALNALQLDAVSRPASNMLNTFLNALPHIFAAIVILGISYVIGRVIARLVAGLLAGFGFDAILERLGFSRQPRPGERTPSEIAGYLVLVSIMLFAAIEAARALQFVLVATLIASFTVLLGNILLGLIIFAVGIYLANLAARAIRGSDVEQAGLLALAARIAILVLSGAMALRQMGLASDIVNLAFGLLLGAIAVAAAVAFGIGGRDVARRELEQWVGGGSNRLITPEEAENRSNPPA